MVCAHSIAVLVSVAIAVTNANAYAAERSGPSFIVKLMVLSPPASRDISAKSKMRAANVAEPASQFHKTSRSPATVKLTYE